MSEKIVSRTGDRFAADAAFERIDEYEFEATATPFDATVHLSESDGRVAVRITVSMPTLDAVVTGETVAPVVEDGWFETLELRLEDAHAVTTAEDVSESQSDSASTSERPRSEDADPPTVEREAETVTMTLTFRTGAPDRAVEDARAVVDYVEGTWLQGVIPGYEYEEPAAGMVEKATQN